MNKMLVLIAAGVALATSAFAQPAKSPLKVIDALNMLAALRNLDGHTIVIKQNGQDTTIVQPWDFGSGSLRLKIARNVSALTAVEKSVEDTRQAIVKEIMKSMPAGTANIQQNTPEWETLQKQFADVLAQPAAVDLVRIRASDLKLDKNEIPITTLVALTPILDDDAPGPK